ncbi:MAG: transposase [Oscillospiraceae bacterium]|nr:transposase [Oscillospiraceae bacterium]
MDYKSRKKLRLDGYDYNSGGAYFVTVCTQNREPILGTIVGADDHIGPQINLTPIGAVVAKYTRTIPGIDSYVIMPNHVHMIIKISAKDPVEGPMWSSAPTNTSLVNLVRSWKTIISKELGETIWQRSYYDHVVRDEHDYLKIMNYMQNNPAKWCEDKYYPGY